MTPIRHMSIQRCRRIIPATLIVTSLSIGCGLNLIPNPMPAQVEGLTLQELQAIQQDGALTNNEKRDAIRDAINAPNNAEGDRLVEFLFTLNVPQ